MPPLDLGNDDDGDDDDDDDDLVEGKERPLVLCGAGSEQHVAQAGRHQHEAGVEEGQGGHREQHQQPEPQEHVDFLQKKTYLTKNLKEKLIRFKMSNVPSKLRNWTVANLIDDIHWQYTQ